MNRSQERAKTRSKRTPRGAARAKRRLSYVPQRPKVKVIGQIVGDTLVIEFDENDPRHVAVLAEQMATGAHVPALVANLIADRVVNRKPAPDVNCITTPDGGCESVEPCMHTVEPQPCLE